MIKIEFPADRMDIAAAIGLALSSLGASDVHAAGEDIGPAYEEYAGEELGGASSVAEEIGKVPGGGDKQINADTARVDHNNVVFNEEFCGKAAKPFYASGAREGQWKKRQGVSDKAYDDWYAAARPADDTNGQDSAGDAPIDTAGAFGNGSTTTGAAPMVPKDCGSFMGWVSAKQAGGLLTQNSIGDAYAQAELQITDLFPPNDSETVAQHIAVLYGILSAQAGA